MSRKPTPRRSFIKRDAVCPVSTSIMRGVLPELEGPGFQGCPLILFIPPSMGDQGGLDDKNYSPIICSTISRERGRLSKSTTMICCHVPSSSALLEKGTTSDGPSVDALT